MYEKETFGIVQHGDSFSREYFESLSDEVRDALITLSRVPDRAVTQDRTVTQGEVVQVIVCHSEPGAWNVEGGPRYQTSKCPPRAVAGERRVVIGRTMFETDRLPAGWSDRLNSLDAIWVPTSFARDIFVAGGVDDDKVRVIGEGVDALFYGGATQSLLTYTPSDKQWELTPSSPPSPPTTVFLSVFKWEERKNWKALIAAYVAAFGANENVTLLIVTSGYHESFGTVRTAFDTFVESNGYEYEAHTQTLDIDGVPVSVYNYNAPTLPPISVTGGIPMLAMPALYRTGSVFVLPSRGEGWGRPYMESMAAGVPVVATQWSGMTAFVTEENGFLVAVDKLVEVEEGAFKGHMWADVCVKRLSSIMREVFEDAEGVVEKKGTRARKDVEEKWRMEIVAEQFKLMVEEEVERKFGGGSGEL